MAASEDGSSCLVSRGRSQSDPSFLSDSSATSTDAGENPGTGPRGGGRRGGGETRQVAWGPRPHAPQLPFTPAFTGGGAAIRFRCHEGPWFLSPANRAASESFVRIGTALLVELGVLQCALLAGCWSLNPQ